MDAPGGRLDHRVALSALGKHFCLQISTERPFTLHGTLSIEVCSPA
jgi:hypothetical protein